MSEAIAAARADLMRLRGTPEGKTIPAPLSSPQAGEAVAPPAPVRTVAPGRPRPPAHYLRGEYEPWREHVSPSGFVAPGAGRDDWWGPI